MTSPRESIDRLLSLPADARLLPDWRRDEPAEESAPPNETDFQLVYRRLLAYSRFEPTRALLAVRHLRTALGRRLGAGENALLTRMEGHFLTGVGRAGEAVEKYREAARRFRESGQGHEEGRTTIGWVYALGLCGRPSEALEAAALGRRRLPRRDVVSRARLESNVGIAWFFAGRYERAAERFRAALRAFARTEMKWDAGMSALNLGHASVRLADPAAARTHFEKARELFEATGMEVPILYAETGLVSLDLASGDWDRGVETIAELRGRFEALGDERASAWLHRELAIFFSSIGATGAARPEAEMALRSFARLGLEGEEAHTAFLAGRLLLSMGSHQEALTQLHRASRTWDSLRHPWFRHLADVERARVLVREGHAERALETLAGAQRFLDRKDPQGDGALCRAVAAEAHLALDRPGLARRLSARAYEEARRHPAHLERPGIALIRAHAEAAAGDSKEAVRWSRRAVVDLERLLTRIGTRALRVLVGGSRDRIYREAVDLVLEHGGPGRERMAVDLVGKARSPVMIEDLLLRDRERFRPEALTAMVRLRDELLSGDGGPEAAEARLEALTASLPRLERRLRGNGARRPALVRRALENRGYDRWKDRIGRDRELVIYDRGARDWRAFVVGDGRVTHVALPGAAEELRRSWIPLRITLETAARAPRDRRREFLERTREDSLRALDRLRAALWEPLALTRSSVVVVPDRDLHDVPLECLAPDAVVSRLPHPLLLRRRLPSRRERALLLNGPGSGARREVREVSRILRGSGFETSVAGRRRTLTDEADPVGVLHVAAHGAFHRRAWLTSGLRLEDGWLGFEQLRSRILSGSLIQFTSCESGLSEELPGSEVDGWITAGLAVGASELVLTLWKVDEASTLAFTRGFYPRWAGGKTAPHAAAEARAAVRRRHPHPYHWAPFLAVG